MTKTIGHYRKIYGTSDSLEFFYNDNLDSRRVVIKSSGTKRDTFEYSSWGSVTHTYGSNNYLAAFTGKDYDTTGFIYFNARYYDPTTGRFLTEDPSRKGVNWYSYCENDPINKTDPTGLLPVDYVANINAFNQAANYTSASFLPGSVPTDIFGQAQGPYNTATNPATGQMVWFQTSAHAGVDRVATQAAQSVVSPVYLRVVEGRDHRLTMNVIGTTRNVSILHLNPADVAAIRPGTLFQPGSVIAPYPNQNFGTGIGVGHIHIQESDIVNGFRTIINPNTHQAIPGASYQYQYGSSAGVNSPIQWNDPLAFNPY